MSIVYLNVKKCELIAVKECSVASYCNIPVKTEVKYLGIIISKNQQNRSSFNFSPIIQKTQRKLNQWLSRDLSLRERVLISKAEGISRLTYTAIALQVDDTISKETDKMLFLGGKNRIHHIRKAVLIQSHENGGLNFLDFSILNNTFKINWIRQFKYPTSVWNMIPLHILSRHF